MIKDASITCVFGRRGAGKTTCVKHLVKDSKALIVFDPVEEYDEGGKRGGIRRVTAAELVPTLRRARTRNFRLAFSPRPGFEASNLDTLCALLMQYQEPYRQGRDTRQITLVVDEADVAYSHGVKPGGNFETVIRRGRHYGINVIAATQFPTQVKPDLRRNASATYIFPLGDASAVQYVVSFLGPEYREAVRALKPHEALLFEGGEVKKHKNPRLR